MNPEKIIFNSLKKQNNIQEPMLRGFPFETKRGLIYRTLQVEPRLFFVIFPKPLFCMGRTSEHTRPFIFRSNQGTPAWGE